MTAHACRLSSVKDQALTWLEKLCSLRDREEALGFLLSRYPFLQAGVPGAVAILGSSEIAAALTGPLKACGAEILGIFDHNPDRCGQSIDSIVVRPVAEMISLSSEVPVIVATHRLGRAFESLALAGFRNLVPFPLLNLLEPEVFPHHPFYFGMLDDLIASRDNVLQLYQRLWDITSRRTLDAVIGFRLTMDPSVFQGLLTPHPYCAPDILCFGPDEVMLDGGAFNGDTLALFSGLVENRFRRILAVEPSEAPRLALAGRYGDDPRIQVIDACLYNENATIVFDTSESRVSAISDSGTCCATVTIDSLELAEQISFIKLNIEGAESQALEGARRTIGERSPKLAIAVYHAPSDLWRIPEEVTALRDDYHLMLRQHDSGTIETVLYGVPKP